MTPLIELDAVGAAYGRLPVLFDVSMSVGDGEVVAVLGANGAGKTSLLRTVMGQLNVTSGHVRLEGDDAADIPPYARARSGFMLVPEGRGLLPFMSVRENLQLGIDAGGTDGQNWDDILDLFPILRDRLEQQAANLSGGEQQMLVIARSLLAQPRCLMLDEPSLGLAPRLVTETFVLLRQARNRFAGTLLLAEQNVREALRLADRVYVLDRGRVVLEGSPEQLAGNDAMRDAYLGGSWHDEAAEVAP